MTLEGTPSIVAPSGISNLSFLDEAATSCRRRRAGSPSGGSRPTRKPCAGAPNPVTDVTIGGAALNPTATYRITRNNFLADGGDDFLSLKAGTGRTTLSDFDIDSLVRYLAPTLTGDPIGPPALDRIDVTP
jgi:2',3'-cyclic-nucleotide 2'-phosphodiesterase (5'-nucleotidase family)